MNGFGFIINFATWLGLRKGDVLCTFLTQVDLKDLSKLSGYEVVRYRPTLYSPFRLLGIGSLINWIMPIIPLLLERRFFFRIGIATYIKATGSVEIQHGAVVDDAYCREDRFTAAGR